MGLLKNQRFTSAREIDEVFASGRHASDRAFKVVVLTQGAAAEAAAEQSAPNSASSAPGALKICVSVSKKVGNAVVRNRMKRQLRELLRALLSELRLTCKVVVIVRPAATGLTFGEMSGSLARNIKRAVA